MDHYLFYSSESSKDPDPEEMLNKCLSYKYRNNILLGGVRSFFFLIGSKSKIPVFIVQYDIVYALSPQMLWADPSWSIQQRLWFFLHLCLPCKERGPIPPGAAGTRGLAASQFLCAGRGSHHISAWSVVGVIIYSWDMYFSRLLGKNPRFGTNRF